MIAKPTTADQAITNAILAMEEAERLIAIPGFDSSRQNQALAYVQVAHGWARVADVLPTMEHVRALNDLIDDGGTVE